MKCKKCNESFPSHVIIDGKFRNLQNRKYCLTCSPFMRHNTRKLEENVDGQKKCELCKRYYNYDRRKGHGTLLCNSCVVNKRRFSVKEKAVALKGGKCSICGYNKTLASLAFHHIDPKSKEFNISGKHCKSWNSIEKELEKCILICLNCHAELHYNINASVV